MEYKLKPDEEMRCHERTLQNHLGISETTTVFILCYSFSFSVSSLEAKRVGKKNNKKGVPFEDNADSGGHRIDTKKMPLSKNAESPIPFPQKCVCV
jgi:hypothetical protein